MSPTSRPSNVNLFFGVCGAQLVYDAEHQADRLGNRDGHLSLSTGVESIYLQLSTLGILKESWNFAHERGRPVQNGPNVLIVRKWQRPITSGYSFQSSRVFGCVAVNVRHGSCPPWKVEASTAAVEIVPRGLPREWAATCVSTGWRKSGSQSLTANGRTSTENVGSASEHQLAEGWLTPW